MTNIWVDGFEGYGGSVDLGLTYINLGGSPASGATGRGGGKGVFLQSKAITLAPLAALKAKSGAGSSAITTLIVGYAWKGSGTATHVTFSNATRNFLAVGIDNVNRVFGIQVPEAGGTDLFSAVSAPMRLDSVWRYYEHKVTLHDGGGSVLTMDYDLHIDEQSVVSVSGVSAVAYSGAKEFVQLTFTSGTFDDLYINEDSGSSPDNGFWGDTRMYQLRPVSDVSVQWTPSTGVVNYANVDDVTTDDDATYNDSSTVTDRDEFEYQDTSLPSGTVIRTVAVMTAARRLSDSGPRQLQSFITHSATTSQGGTHDLSDTFYIEQYRVPVCPSTSAAWTPAEVDAAKGGYELTA